MTNDKITLEDRSLFEQNVTSQHWDTFYHYFPLVFAMSKTTGTKWHLDDTFADLWCDKDEVFFVGPNIKNWDIEMTDFLPKRVWIGPNKTDIKSYRNELYDVNYIFDLKETVQIKNFRKNVNRFINEHNPEWVPTTNSEEAWEVVKQWYRTSKREEFTDFGYTQWLTQNFAIFPDIHRKIVKINDKAVGFSLWGHLNDQMAIHVIAKDTGIPYLQDYLRMMTYKDMIEAGYQTVNDGSDCGEHGIRMYKMKLRPKLIVPIWSWVLK